MAAWITGVAPGSPAQHAGVRAGECLLRIGAHDIADVLDYQFYATDSRLELTLADKAGNTRLVRVHKDDYEDLGLDFATYLMDQKRSCKNHCVFCFIDQLPKGLRPTLYFKDDDARLSFLMGNYITLTNVTDADVSRIINMHISPVNISVHTTDPALRVRMMKNPHAGEALRHLYRLAEAGTKINCQLVLCPEYNDGEALEQSLRDLGVLFPSVQSVSAVPVGLSRYREGLAPLRPFTPEEAARVVKTIERFGAAFHEKHGTRLAFASDEFYIKMGKALPQADYYEEFPQLENGVGMVSLFTAQFQSALKWAANKLKAPRRVALATGMAFAPFLRGMAAAVAARVAGLSCEVYPIKNRFFGTQITVAGLITGKDLTEQLSGLLACDELLLPATMLRAEGDLFLDGVSIDDVRASLGVKVTPVENNGAALVDALMGE